MADMERVHTLMRRQHGLITRSQALECGLTARADRVAPLERPVAARSSPNVYALAGTPPTWEQAVLAAVLRRRRPMSLASHGTAGRLRRLKHVEDVGLESSRRSGGTSDSTASSGIGPARCSTPI